MSPSLALLLSKSTFFYFSLVNFSLSSFLLTNNSFSCIKRIKSVHCCCICTLLSIFIYITFSLFFDWLFHCFSLVTLEVKVLFIYFNFWCNFLTWLGFAIFCCYRFYSLSCFKRTCTDSKWAECLFSTSAGFFKFTGSS